MTTAAASPNDSNTARAALTAAASTIQSTLAALEPPPPELQPGQFVCHPPVVVDDVSRLNMEVNAAHKLVRSVLGPGDPCIAALLYYLELLLRCLASMLPTHPTTLEPALLRELRRLKKVVLSIPQRRSCIPPSQKERDAWKQLSRQHQRAGMRALVTPERVTVFDGAFVSGLVKWCTAVAWGCGPNSLGCLPNLAEVNALVAAMRFTPKYRPILVQLGSAPPHPLPDCPGLWLVFRAALDMDMAPHLEAGVEHVQALMRHAQGLLAAGITKRKVAASFVRARETLTTLCDGMIPTLNKELVDEWRSCHPNPDPFALLCVAVPLCVRLARLLDDKDAAGRLRCVCEEARAWAVFGPYFVTLKDARAAYQKAIGNGIYWIEDVRKDAEFGLLMLALACTIARLFPSPPPVVRCRLGVDDHGNVSGLDDDDDYYKVRDYGMSKNLNSVEFLFAEEATTWHRVVFFIRYGKLCLPAVLDAAHAARLRAMLPQLAELPESL